MDCGKSDQEGLESLIYPDYCEGIYSDRGIKSGMSDTSSE